MNPMLLIMVVYVFVGALMAAISVPLIRRKVKPNPWYGFRVKATLEDSDVWYAVNEFAGKCLLVAGLAISVAALVLFFVGLPFVAYCVACLIVTIIAVVTGMVFSRRFLSTVRRN